MRFLAAVAVLSSILHPAVAAAQSADAVQRALSAEASRLSAWASDKVVVFAVRRQNAKGASIADGQRLDAAWVAGKAEALVQEVTTGACADHLRELVGSDARYSETFLSDANGALVCATARTSDYWQGDETKFTGAFREGKGAVFIDRPKLDESAKAALAQISLPVMENGVAIGVLTVGVRIDRLK